MPYLPKFQKQLGRGTPVPGRTRGSRDCGPRTVQMGLDFITKGEKVPGITEIRRRMGRPGPQQTNIWNAQQCVESYVRIRGRKPLRYFIKDNIDSVSAAIRNGKYVHACIDYGRWNQLMRKTGDPNFKGGHSVGLLGQRKKNGTVQWLLFDPIDDGRRAGIAGPGPRWVPRWKVIKAMEAFAGARGRCYAGVFGGGQKR